MAHECDFGVYSTDFGWIKFNRHTRIELMKLDNSIGWQKMWFFFLFLPMNHNSIKLNSKTWWWWCWLKKFNIVIKLNGIKRFYLKKRKKWIENWINISFDFFIRLKIMMTKMYMKVNVSFFINLDIRSINRIKTTKKGIDNNIFFFIVSSNVISFVLVCNKSGKIEVLKWTVLFFIGFLSLSSRYLFQTSIERVICMKLIPLNNFKENHHSKDMESFFIGSRLPDTNI